MHEQRGLNEIKFLWNAFCDCGWLCSCRHHIYIATSTVGNNDASIRGVSLRRDRASNSYHVTPRHNAEGRLDVRRRSSWRHFVFRFVAGFDYNGFVYFVTVQREFPTARKDSSLVTRLVRLCPRDVEFQSYTELTLECRPLTGSSMTGPATAAQLAFKVCLVSTVFLKHRKVAKLACKVLSVWLPPLLSYCRVFWLAQFRWIN